MGQAYIETVRADKGNLVVNTILVTASDKVPCQFIFSAAVSVEEIKRQLAAKLSSLELSDAAVKSLPPGLLDLTPSGAGSISPADQARVDFLGDVDQLRRLQRAAGLGLIASDDGQIAELVKSLQSRLTAEFLVLI